MRRNGKFARLPQALREELNVMLRDGATYREIIERAAQAGIRLGGGNIVTWKKGGYQDWLKEQSQFETIKARREFALALLQANSGATIQEAGLQIAAAQIYDLLINLNPKSLKKKLETDPAQYTRMITTLTRLSEGGLKYEQYRAEVAERKAKIVAELARNQGAGLSEESKAVIERELNLL
jgi:hypothetical protein